MPKEKPAHLVLAREKVFAAFKVLSKNGYVCRSRFRTCVSDASYDIDEILEQQRSKGKHSSVFWHTQTEETFWKAGLLHLYFTPEPSGKAIAKALEDEGLCVLWNRSPYSAIAVCDAETLQKFIDEPVLRDSYGFALIFLERVMSEYKARVGS